MQKLFLILFFFKITQSNAQLYTKIEVGSKKVLSYSLDADGYPIDDTFRHFWHTTAQVGGLLGYKNPKTKIGVELGIYRAEYAVAINLDVTSYTSLNIDGFGTIRTYYSQWDVPIRVTFPLYTTNKQQMKKKSKIDKIKLSGSLGLVYMQLTDSFLNGYVEDHVIERKTKDNAFTQKLSYSQIIRGRAVDGGLAFETGCTFDIEMNSRLSMSISPRAVLGITPMVSYFFVYEIDDAIHKQKNLGENSLFAKGDNFSLNVGFKYQLR
ncbi:MAG: hypothetical protein RLZZ292_2606 [Bacteroidota bacterium]|jgi:hypothetical protein